MKKISLLLTVTLSILSLSHAYALDINVVNGTSPAGGYLPLSLFGIAPIAGVGDETITNFDVPSFSYAGESWTRIGIVSNGYLVVGGGTDADVQFINPPMPNNAGPNNILAPFWTDLNPSFGGEMRIGVLTDGINSWIVTDWQAVVNYNDRQPNSFEVWLGIGSVEDISFAYGLVSAGDLGFLTVGAEDKTGTVGDSYYFNGFGTLPVEGTMLQVISSGLPVNPIPEPSTMLLIVSGLVGAAGLRRRFRK